jgi:chromosome segregation ATPase
MPIEIWVALIGFGGVGLTVLGSIWIYRKTSQQTEIAAHQSDTVEADKTAIQGLRELAEQNRKDRAEWRAERAQMVKSHEADRKRLDKLEAEMTFLRAEREQNRITIENLKTERRWRVNYIHVLIDYIKRLGRTPPEPEDPIVMQAD